MLKRVAVVGATGYAGAELTTILARHAEAQIVALFSSSNGVRGPVSPSLPQLIAEPFTLEALLAATPDIVFLATPNEVSAELPPKLLHAGMQGIDLSGAFRLPNPALYPNWYGFEHARPALLKEAVYGLTELCNG